MDKILYIVSAVHLTLCPFTKVEESFNIQAIHDILYLRGNLSQYDHLEFPGVVPRTFIGPLVISMLSFPIFMILQFYAYNKFISQLLVRAVLGVVVITSIRYFQKSITKIFGKGVADWFIVVTASQYHLMFYSSRPLPNIFAFPLVMVALSSWIRGKHVALIWSSAAAVLVFRSELVIYLGIIILIELFYGRLKILRLLKIGCLSALAVLILTVVIDSVFWGHLLWPEGEVLWFNAILNKSSQWGTSPFLWYFYSAIPRGLGFSIFLIPFGMVYDVRVIRLVIPAVIFVLIYSILPHKELRFIIYVFPVLNVSTAVYCNRIWQTKLNPKGLANLISLAFCAGHIVGNIILTILLASAAKQNYPGGNAMTLLHLYEHNNFQTNYSVHIGNLAAQTGVTRFTQLSDHWIYKKTENLQPGCDELMSYTHLVVGASSRDNNEMLPYRHTHSVISTVTGFSHVSFNYNMFPPVKIKTKTQLFILKKNLVKSGVKSSIKKIVEDYKNELESEEKIDLNLNLLEKKTKPIKVKVKKPKDL
ncbi:probable Dol-P-Man:Man(7)GlcNAc(2)-PP-Dol alpha-1,6-mannosyltransferase [Adelges cooleyi]|uniref:probable Dol-P-Man:Man(7)GlcNAc(2)-PP-Dol alpha-1,6-mannosyltransferase n=1 Tax=Adelges cooleyi TaxID=133065 RepID=UPI00217F9B65|nr:probable Dol-P-Man:Man(7)GlcNAc(2)-PP-Dol alpha-1,6-mannosyltransferase [Adelges cooleyi]XP_050439363.1 probable Dol-P-Man:Man(7)GlcNAc(2)-PP-Dol alpha-1,6-mannosyltransferase [Adelges cooleyi]XP_050439364.1 probable Dol-P-Man:Man(7)GlcNAc(2)-PP-Dol alpha-1,6-mannosyltransferase [Adelges cooleyi]XP_050439365.1 probable Dol-P-Man:Man(7)GlcNAc(2)-PP-Dol alpha-1,6-mannosyltransferase [Adelges cooleyi]XP_050439366.1 probable Dol-P-Man:Man(7)GlcNAc(2)-PP-Dol alpha-1,6-mannosyltransferase [Adelges